MFESLKDLLLAAVGGAAISAEKASELVKSLVEKGNVTVEEGKKFSEELIKKATSSDQVEAVDKDELQAILIEMNVAQQQDIQALDEKIQKLEKKLNDIEEHLAK